MMIHNEAKTLIVFLKTNFILDFLMHEKSGKESGTTIQ